MDRDQIARKLFEGLPDALVADTSLSGLRVVRELEALVARRQRILPGIPIRTSCRCLEMSMATSKVAAVEWMAVIAGLLSGVVVQNHC